MSCRTDAETIFERIGIGADNAVQRPSNSYTDRILRRLIEDANISGDCIISGRTGYYRPRRNVPDENLEFKKYERQELKRARAILYKRRKMIGAYGNLY